MAWKRVWSDDEWAFVRANAGTMSDPQIAEALTRTSGRAVTRMAVREARRRMRLAKSPKGERRHARDPQKLREDVPSIFGDRWGDLPGGPGAAQDASPGADLGDGPDETGWPPAAS
jgi:hypothetical protein